MSASEMEQILTIENCKLLSKMARQDRCAYTPNSVAQNMRSPFTAAFLKGASLATSR